MNSARSKARDARRVSDIKAVQTALEMYYAEHGTYPGNGHYSSNFSSTNTMCGSLGPGSNWSTALSGDFSSFLSTLPSDPSGDDVNYCYTYSRVNNSGVNCTDGDSSVNLATREYVLGFKAEQNLSSKYTYFGGLSNRVYCVLGPAR